ncbi:MAG: nuclease [Rhizobiales bacterium 32-66-11]|nr:MAG: nuclease [Rhizobiales bacterium 32-66-11]
MTRGRNRGARTGTIVMVATLAATTLAGAQSPERSGLYSPGSALQSPPLRVEVLDGTRFRDIETQAVYRLYGIDTCAPGQAAHLGRQPWPCGTVAAAWLVSATLNKWVACNILRDEQGEHLARCASADHADIGADMIRDGIAMTLPPSEQDSAIRAYVSAERDARKAYRGIWASTFQMPWEYRTSDRRRAIAKTGAEAAP